MEVVKESQSKSEFRERKTKRLRRNFTVKSATVIVLLSVLAATLLAKALPRLRSTKPYSRPPSGRRLIAQPPTLLTELLARSRSQLETCDVALMNLLCAEGLRGAENLDLGAGLATLDQWADRVAFETRRHRYQFQKSPGEFDHSEAKFRMLMLGVVLQTNFGVRYNPDRITAAGVFEPSQVFFADSRDVLLHGLLGERRMGTCSSLPVLYIAVGRRLGYPLKLVKTKTHLLVRWDSPAEQFNIETSGRGVGWHDDDHFRKWPMPVSEEEIAAFGLLKSMTPAQEFATFLSIRASCLRAQGRAEEAITCYEHAIQLDPDSLEHRLLLAAARREGAEFLESASPFALSPPLQNGHAPKSGAGVAGVPHYTLPARSFGSPFASDLSPPGSFLFPRSGVYPGGPGHPDSFHPTIPQTRTPNQ